MIYIAPNENYFNSREGEFDFEAYLTKYNIDFERKGDEFESRYFFICPYNPDHGPYASVWQNEKRELVFLCYYDDCRSRTWRDFREKVSGSDDLSPFVKGRSVEHKETDVISSSADIKTNPWDDVSDMFLRRPFPWDLFSLPISTSLKQLARACATSDIALPGVALAILASVLGSTVMVRAKESWVESLIMWMMDIRGSGTGKTPALKEMVMPLRKAQELADLQYMRALEEWQSLIEVAKVYPPKRPRSYFLTGLTIEGLRTELRVGHGGILCCPSELSSFISGQNEYKRKGTDREEWLSLWDGHDARVSRSKETIVIRGARVSVCGGIQPLVFKLAFGRNGGIFLQDGTLFRFLLTYEPDCFTPLTEESWDHENRQAWESMINNAMAWADGVTSTEGWRPRELTLTAEALQYFLTYRNDLFRKKCKLPTAIEGFLPKAISYILRITGLLHCMDSFCDGTHLDQILTLEDIGRGIKVTEFYLSHLVDVVKLIEDSGTRQESERTQVLSATLLELKPDLDCGRLAVGVIWEKFNSLCEPAKKLASEKRMGTVLRAHGLTVSGKHDSNGRRGVYCLEWDNATDRLVESSPQRPHKISAGTSGHY
jgi:hypothetical protein